MNHTISQVKGDGEGVAYRRLAPLHRSRHGSVPDLNEDELADPQELERAAWVADWWPIMAILSPQERTRLLQADNLNDIAAGLAGRWDA